MAVDPTYQTANYEKQGGAVLVIGGTLEIATGGKITNNGTQASAIVALTDSSGGTADNTVAAVAATNSGDVSATINNNFADLAAKVNALIAAVHGAGITA